ncbi:putative uncharacterized protein ENSP00000383309 [Panicum virgatum]|uniref:putative uncharacterized protein ENSP00000383309 n=1 Tax=Panicum virgatum TaxID=38727 RepID=UPI0019D5BF16|nr:putative uncharacterized protein ENSP00000383309 [Panicum virgatum]
MNVLVELALTTEVSQLLTVLRLLRLFSIPLTATVKRARQGGLPARPSRIGSSPLGQKGPDGIGSSPPSSSPSPFASQIDAAKPALASPFASQIGPPPRPPTRAPPRAAVLLAASSPSPSRAPSSAAVSRSSSRRRPARGVLALPVCLPAGHKLAPPPRLALLRDPLDSCAVAVTLPLRARRRRPTTAQPAAALSRATKGRGRGSLSGLTGRLLSARPAPPEISKEG